VFVTSETFSEIETKVESWLNKDFFKVEKLKSDFPRLHQRHQLLEPQPHQRDRRLGPLPTPRRARRLDKSKLSSLNWAFLVAELHRRSSQGCRSREGRLRLRPSLIKIETFEGFAYEVKVGSSQPIPRTSGSPSAASAELPKERVAPADEKAEDKEKNEKAWKEQQDKLKEKLKKEQALSAWVYKVAKWTVDSVLKDRSALLADKKAAGQGAPAGAEGLPPLPGQDAGVPPFLAPPEGGPDK
jgi:hypothetical protein